MRPDPRSRQTIYLAPKATNHEAQAQSIFFVTKSNQSSQVSLEESKEEPATISGIAKGHSVDNVVVGGTTVWWPVLEVVAEVSSILILVVFGARWTTRPQGLS